ncbi:MAG TPA: hypothetical protein P5210_09410, partial [Draconibacterium sp.]|nr:hypothetical protein [Draconibacterium sp.]
MKALVITSMFFLFLSVCFQSNAQENKLLFGTWINDWYLAGPFPLSESSDETRHLPGFEIDFLQKNGGEKSPVVKQGQIVKFKGGSVNWIKYDANNSVINLDEIISKKSFVTAYAYSEIYSDFDGMALLALGSNDGGRLWFNGEQVWDCPEARGFVPDDDLIPVAVKKGLNTILLKIEERGNKWEFGVRILPFNLNEFVVSNDLFQVNTGIDGTPVL